MLFEKNPKRYYIDEQAQIIIPLPVGKRFGLVEGEKVEVNIFYNENIDMICIEKSVPSCNYCGTENNIAEFFENAYLCQKCLEEFIMKHFVKS